MSEYLAKVTLAVTGEKLPLVEKLAVELTKVGFWKENVGEPYYYEVSFRSKLTSNEMLDLLTKNSAEPSQPIRLGTENPVEFVSPKQAGLGPLLPQGPHRAEATEQVLVKPEFPLGFPEDFVEPVDWFSDFLQELPYEQTAPAQPELTELVIPRAEAVEPQVASDLVILAATYGGETPESRLDVTELIRSRVAEGNLRAWVTNDIMGLDPAPGIVKVLEVKYVYKGQELQKIVPETWVLSLP